ncbi:hypothetical protein [Caulobacter sp. DWR1-3-2b1]|uniref:hypothetical protein n=1 Tax=Caulobacter sp. DWR1-3-2b1 TaxID=2804670 RepID=UPI003CF336AB
MILTAFRPEAVRFVRLASVYEEVEQAIQVSGRWAEWEGALCCLDDAKGDLTATWRNAKDRERFSGLVDAAWRKRGEDGVIHQVETVEALAGQVGGDARSKNSKRGPSLLSILFIFTTGALLGGVVVLGYLAML